MRNTVAGIVKPAGIVLQGYRWIAEEPVTGAGEGAESKGAAELAEPVRERTSSETEQV